MLFTIPKYVVEYEGGELDCHGRDQVLALVDVLTANEKYPIVIREPAEPGAAFPPRAEQKEAEKP